MATSEVTPQAPQSPAGKTTVAPAWHTALGIAAMVGVAVMTGMQAGKMQNAAQHPMAIYLPTIAWEWVLFLWAWWGLRMNGLRLREIMGEPWHKFEDVLLDIAIAIAFWIVSLLVLGGLGYLLGLTKQAGNDEAMKNVLALAPRGWQAIVVVIILGISAGICEEVVFRGYLLRQFSAAANNVFAGVIVSSLIFGIGHMYEGGLRMILIFVYGAMFCALALLRKNLRPGMISHALHDIAVLLLLSFASSHGMMKLPGK